MSIELRPWRWGGGAEPVWTIGTRRKEKSRVLSGIVPRFFGSPAHSLVIISVFQKKGINTQRRQGGALVLGDRVALNDVVLNRQDVGGAT